ncbi:hypothetical protein [Peteryoungia ipomoeae]|uniref:hypothetical protein n=1 Tax=Peteryoungia ipomoeae TaxID=1210932 RepID=UPI001456285F|nr:hypothetical protein [Peteryoungia ipomoeae]
MKQTKQPKREKNQVHFTKTGIIVNGPIGVIVCGVLAAMLLYWPPDQALVFFT